jgi:hypothetical protein
MTRTIYLLEMACGDVNALLVSAGHNLRIILNWPSSGSLLLE